MLKGCQTPTQHQQFHNHVLYVILSSANSYNTLHLHYKLMLSLSPGLPDNEGVFSMLRRRCKDEKLNVRKAALQAMESAIRFEAPTYRKENLELLRDHCRDPGLSVRKQSLQSLTDLLLDMPKDKLLQQ